MYGLGVSLTSRAVQMQMYVKARICLLQLKTIWSSGVLTNKNKNFRLQCQHGTLNTTERQKIQIIGPVCQKHRKPKQFVGSLLQIILSSSQMAKNLSLGSPAGCTGKLQLTIHLHLSMLLQQYISIMYYILLQLISILLFLMKLF